jgi:hypothetical protein
MPEHVRVQALCLQAGAGFRRGGGVDAESALDGVAAEPPPGPGWEQWLVWGAGTFSCPFPEYRLGLAGERDGALLAPFAFAADVTAGARELAGLPGGRG